ncbi:MAG: hypothetical protein KDK08_12035 [Rhizobiaceae bacterium]|nr:hypothetical protein [Rhizobiaceae bacterium]
MEPSAIARIALNNGMEIFMARDMNTEVDTLKDEVASLRDAVMKQANSAKDRLNDAADSVRPHARRAVANIRAESDALSQAARENPSLTLGVLAGAMAIGALFGFALSEGARRR